MSLHAITINDLLLFFFCLHLFIDDMGPRLVWFISFKSVLNNRQFHVEFHPHENQKSSVKNAIIGRFLFKESEEINYGLRAYLVACLNYRQISLIFIVKSKPQFKFKFHTQFKSKIDWRLRPIYYQNE